MLLAIDYSYLLAIKTRNLEMGKNENQSKDQYCSIDINKLEEILEPKADCCIYRVPQYLRKVNEEAYTPKLISIGPLHYHCREELMGMETQKRRYRVKFGERVGISKFRELEKYISDQEQHIRDHYAVSSTLECSEYITMILNDAVFIIELFMRNNHRVDDFLLDKSQLKTHIMLDLLLLENQIPFFVLNDLYLSAFPSRSDEYPSFFTLCKNFFSCMGMFNWTFSEEPQVKHFTDFLRHAVVVQVQPTAQPPNGETPDLPNATKLNESGLQFKGIKGKGKYLLDINLDKRKSRIPLIWFDETELEIPFIEIYDDTECLFRNLMALEVFHYPTQTYVCNYADLMGYLIDTAKDVDLLVEKKIIGNFVGDSEAIAKMFNTICSRITPSPSCYNTIATDMTEHYNNRWNHLKATLRSVYFTNLWTGTATVAAVVLLILTVIQTVCSIMQV
ncbi:hypothetical protein EZV62_009532 [Acer yangbiense]|uniref:Uncharacterized protein n=1 Tax=Acer yangbiense TaxID=1000413 RepID=A0A5C7I0T8_9ROSI|nr:hypothetical protein EZV62_009532 [Acer yangbiense]